MLEVVEQEQQLALADVLLEPILSPERLRDRLHNQSRISQGREPDPEDARLELRHELGGGLDRQARLPGATGAAEGQQMRLVAEERRDLLNLALAADEGARRPGQVRVRNRLQGREALAAELEERDRLRKVLQTVLAELDELPVGEGACRS